MYTCKHFKLYELVDKYTYEKYGQDAWMFFNPNALRMIDGVWEYVDTVLKPRKTVIIINNWKWGGRLQERGLRPIYMTTGAKYSQHRFGNGFDCTVKDISSEDMRKEILNNKDHELLQYINCIEADVPQLHLDGRNIPDRIRIVHP